MAMRKLPGKQLPTPRAGTSAKFGLRFGGLIVDMYDSPDRIKLRSVKNGAAGARQDAENIRGYFANASRSVFAE